MTQITVRTSKLQEFYDAYQDLVNFSTSWRQPQESERIKFRNIFHKYATYEKFYLSLISSKTIEINFEDDPFRSIITLTYDEKESDRYNLFNYFKCIINFFDGASEERMTIDRLFSYIRFSTDYPAPLKHCTKSSTGVEIINENDNNKGENNNMNLNFDFGPVDSNIRMSVYGMAVKNKAGTWVSYDPKNQNIVDVDIFNFNGNKFMFKVPVTLKDVKVGDVVIHNRKPMFVTSAPSDNTNNLTVIDIYEGESKTVIPTTNMFGFNFITKVVSFINMEGVNAPTQDNPFGNMWPLFMCGEDGDFSNDDAMMMMFFMAQNKQAPSNLFQNPYFMMYMLKNSKMGKEMLLPMLMMNGNFSFGNNNTSN